MEKNTSSKPEDTEDVFGTKTYQGRVTRVHIVTGNGTQGFRVVELNGNKSSPCVLSPFVNVEIGDDVDFTVVPSTLPLKGGDHVKALEVICGRLRRRVSNNGTTTWTDTTSFGPHYTLKPDEQKA